MSTTARQRWLEGIREDVMRALRRAGREAVARGEDLLADELSHAALELEKRIGWRIDFERNAGAQVRDAAEVESTEAVAADVAEAPWATEAADAP